MDPMTIMSTITPPIVLPIITANGAPWKVAPVPCAIGAVSDPVGAVPVPRVVSVVWTTVDRAVGTLWTPVESLEAERLANVPGPGIGAVAALALNCSRV